MPTPHLRSNPTRALSARGALSPRGVVLTLLVVTVTAALGTSIANVTLPLVSEEFQVSMASSQAVTLAYILTTTLLIVPIGGIADRVGRERTLLIALVIFAGASVLAALAPTLGVLVAARAIQGVGAAAMTALPVALVRQNIDPARVGRTMGMIGSSMAAGMALGPALGGLLMGGPGWRWAFVSLALLSAATIIPAFRLPRSVISPTERRRISGFDPRNMVRLGLLPDLTIAFLGAFVMMAFSVVPPFYLTDGLQLSAGWMGLAMSVGPIAAIIAGTPAGHLVDRHGARFAIIAGTGLLTLGAILLSVLPAWLGIAGFLMSAVVLTPGNQLVMASNNTAVTAKAGSEHQAMASSSLGLARNLGFITSTGVVAYAYEAAASTSGAAAGATAGMQLTFGISAAVALAALLIALRRTRPTLESTPLRGPAPQQAALRR
ncbi:MAG TPA: MFS transporter [Actinomycetaceae bacterium]|nr:MFS transporter [Actinomycetaceae bacterium]